MKPYSSPPGERKITVETNFQMAPIKIRAARVVSFFFIYQVLLLRTTNNP